MRYIGINFFTMQLSINLIHKKVKKYFPNKYFPGIKISEYAK